MILFLFFLAALNVVDRFYYCIFLAALIFVLTPRRKICVNGSLTALLFLSLSILIFNPISGDSLMNMIRPFTYPLCYLMGTGLFSSGRETTLADVRWGEKRTLSAIYVLSGGSFLHFLLNMVENWESIDRNKVVDFWTKSEMAATAQAAIAALAVATAIAFLFSKSGKQKTLIAIVVLIVVISYNLVLAGRTLFVVILVLLAATGLYVMLTEKAKMPKMIVATLLLALLLVWLYNEDAFGVKTTVESSNFYTRFYSSSSTQELDDDSRIKHKLAYVERFFDSMLGGGKIREDYGHSAHDLYLDTYDESGIFALLSVLCYMAASLIRLLQCIRSKILSKEIRLLILCVYLVCNMFFWLEPVLRGIPWLFASYCFMDGVVTNLLSKEKKHKSQSIEVRAI